MSQDCHCGCCGPRESITLPVTGFRLPGFGIGIDVDSSALKTCDCDNERGTYELCEFYYFRHPDLKPGFQPAQGGLLENAAGLYPEAWAYLQTEAGQKLCITEEEWQAMTQAVWHTNADGTTVGWNGIGGAPFYAPDYSTGTLRLPDLRGMYAEGAGFDALDVGGVHGDAGRDFECQFWAAGEYAAGFLYLNGHFLAPVYGSGGGRFPGLSGSLSRVAPTAAKNQPRAYGVLPCVYLGAPR